MTLRSRPSGLSRAARALGLLLLTFVTACGGAGEPGAAAQGAQGPPPAPVQLEAVHETRVDDSSEYVGTLRSLTSTTIQPQVDGQVTRVLVKSGDRVQQGTPLFQIDPRRQQATVASQSAAANARAADVTYARQQVTRLRDLHAQGVVSQQELEQAETALHSAEADLASLEARLREQRVSLGYFQVLAPTRGVIGDVTVRVGDRVTPETVLTTVDQNETLELNISVPVERGPSLRVGLPVQILDAEGKPLADTTLTYVSPRADAATQSIQAKATVPNAGGRLRSSQYVQARLRWSSAQGIVVPVLSVLRVTNQNFVFVAEQGPKGLVARQRPVRLGAIVGDDYTVLDGLKTGERVVVSGVQKLLDGAPIQPQG